MNRIVCFIIFTCFFYSAKALPRGEFPDSVYRENIKTVLFYMEGWEFSYPILNLNESSQLLFSFDDLDLQSKSYNYSIIHCDADWNASRLSFNEYMDGYFINPLSEFQSSLSTHVPYIHYSLSIPNENISLKVSGNYMLIVYENNDNDHPIITKRFVVSEEKVTIDAEEKRPVLPKYQSAYQQIVFSVFFRDYSIEDPQGTVKVVIVKNNQWKFILKDLKPLYIKDRELVYDDVDKAIFQGGNEYRTFDIKALKYQSMNIASIRNSDSAYHVVLHTDKTREGLGYFYNEDFNGKYFIENKEGTQSAIDAEYAYVKFRFQADPFIDGDIFIYGALSDYNFSEGNKMHFNTNENVFEKEMLVKQGYYNYNYVFKPRTSFDIDETYFENCFYETENDYIIYVYHRQSGGRYDRLIGVKVINSLKKTH